MISFDINGAIIEFDEKMNNYNNIRKFFKSYALDKSSEFEEESLNKIQTIKQISEKCLLLGEKIIDEAIKKGVENIVKYDVITIDSNIFKENYCEKYLDFTRLLNNFSKDCSNTNKGKKHNNAKFYDIKPHIERLSEYIYNDCFNIHYAVVDALLEKKVKNIQPYVDNKLIRQADALFNNYKDGFISKPDECRVIKQIITLNPYREDVYEYIIKEDGDFGREIEKLTEFLGYDIKIHKSKLMNIYIKKLIENDINDINSAKEKVQKYAKYIGCTDSTVYISRIDDIYTFEKA